METEKKVLVKKADGGTEAFDRAKLERSLRRSGATEDSVREIVAHIETELYDGISTREIYRHARVLLKKQGAPAAAKYSLRRALFDLGPTGFPFETFLAELFAADGYETKTGITLRGRCVEHEVDLVAYKPGRCLIAEAKFHANPGLKSDLQVALYTHARFEDLKGARLPHSASHPITDAYLITNTKFTSVAIEYAACVGLRLLSWNYPPERTLQDAIQEAGIYPVTALSTLSGREKRLLLGRGMALCRDMPHWRDALRSLGFSTAKIERMIAESVNLCRN